jgi:hypothetical protein
MPNTVTTPVLPADVLAELLALRRSYHSAGAAVTALASEQQGGTIGWNDDEHLRWRVAVATWERTFTEFERARRDAHQRYAPEMGPWPFAQLVDKAAEQPG